MNNLDFIATLVLWFLAAGFILFIIGAICDLLAYIRAARAEIRKENTSREKICSAYRPNTKR